MDHLIRLFIGCMGVFLTVSGFESQTKSASPAAGEREQKHIVLLGASVGKAWRISSLPERAGEGKYIFSFKHGGSRFDKSAKLREIIFQSERKPDAIILKECAAYFPHELESYLKLMQQWITECKKNAIIPIPATVVPVTRLSSIKKWMIDIIKGRNPLKNGNPFKHWRMKSILAYNDWIREYSRKEGLVVLDLEAAVRYSGNNRFLKENLAKIDGLHLNRKAYALLDQIVYATMAKITWGSFDKLK